MNIEERIREIVREELAKAQYAKPVVPKYEPRNWEDVRVGKMEKCPTCGRKDFSTCVNTLCLMRPSHVSYAELPPNEPNSSTFVISAGGPACGRKDASTCTTPFCVMHSPVYNPPVKMTVHDTVADPLKLGSFTFTSDGAPVYTPPEDKRTGCTCPPGAQTSCPDKTCPWKP